MSAPNVPRVRVAVTMGDPRGVGPEVVVKALRRGVQPGVQLLIVGSMAVLRRDMESFDVAAPPTVDSPDAMGDEPAAVLDLDNFPVDALEPREPSAASGCASLECIEEAVRLALAGDVDAVVTAPISKEAIAAAGSPFAGHTEMLGQLSGGTPVMLMVSRRLRVALVTTHVALRDVPRLVTADKIVSTAAILQDALRRYFGVTAPRIALCGLNPHCSDGGRFGDEEARIVSPAVEIAASRGILLHGPRPADTAFAQASGGAYDAVIALYHDQGLIPVKLDGLARVVNVTLGLPFVRTSVGHGTACDIAGTGCADENSLVEAIGLAACMARAAGVYAGADN